MVDPEVNQSARAAGPAPIRPSWGLGDALAAWFVGMLCGSLTVAVAFSASDAEEMADLPIGWFSFGQLGQWLGLLAVVLVVTRYKGNGPVADLGLRLRPRDIGWGALVGVGVQIVLIPLLYLPYWYFSDVDPEEMSEPAQGLADTAHGVWGIALLVLAVGVVAPIVEEIFYRGLVQQAMQRRLGAWPGLVVTAVVFGAIHFQLLQFPALVVIGLALGILTHRSGRLGPAIAAHMFFNMVTVGNLVWLS